MRPFALCHIVRVHDIQAVLKAKRGALERLREEIQILERAMALLEGDRVESPRADTVEPSTTKRLTGTAAKGHFSATSQVGLTIAVLGDSGVPLHINDILREIELRGGRAKKASVVGSISRLVGEKRVFFRKKPNVYGLLEWMGRGSNVPALSLMASETIGSGNAGSAGSVAVSKTTTGWPARH